MTPAQLEEQGIALDKWDTLQDICFQMLFSNESHLYVSQESYQYYFDSDNELIFVRYLRGQPVKAEDRRRSLEYSKVNLKTKSGDVVERYIPMELGGIVDNEIGRYHLVLDMNALVALL